MYDASATKRRVIEQFDQVLYVAREVQAATSFDIFDWTLPEF
jgi:hypothetical protein